MTETSAFCTNPSTLTVLLLLYYLTSLNFLSLLPIQLLVSQFEAVFKVCIRREAPSDKTPGISIQSRRGFGQELQRHLLPPYLPPVSDDQPDDVVQQLSPVGPGLLGVHLRLQEPDLEHPGPALLDLAPAPLALWELCHSD